MKQLLFDFYYHDYCKPIIKFEQEITVKLQEKMALAIIEKIIYEKEENDNDKK